MKVALVRLGRARTPWADQAVADFSRRLPRSLPFVEETLDPEPFRGDVEAVRQQLSNVRVKSLEVVVNRVEPNGSYAYYESEAH